MAITYDTIDLRETSHDQWLEIRRQGIGGSDVAALCGLSPYKSRLELYMEKIGEIIPSDISDKPAVYWGNVLEDVVAREYAERTGNKVQRRNAMLQHKQYPWMRADLDRMIVGHENGPGILECKTAGQFMAKEWGPEGSDFLPDAYHLQVQHYFAVTGYKWGRLAVLIGGRDFRIYEIHRDDEVISNLIKIEEDFWNNYVLAKNPPEATELDSELLQKMYPEASGVADLPEANVLVEEYLNHHNAEKASKKAKDAVANKLKKLLGEADADVATVGDHRISWKETTSNRFNTTKFKKDMPDLYNDYTVSSTSRRFTVK